MAQDHTHEHGKTKSPEKIKKTTNDGALSEKELDQVNGGKTGPGTISKF